MGKRDPPPNRGLEGPSDVIIINMMITTGDDVNADDYIVGTVRPGPSDKDPFEALRMGVGRQRNTPL